MANQYVFKTGVKLPELDIGDYSLPSSIGTTGQVLSVDGSGNLIFSSSAGGGLSALEDDTAPVLGGDLGLNAKSFIVGTGNAVTFDMDDGQAVNLGRLTMMTPETLSATEVTPNVEYEYTWTFPNTYRSTYVDYFYDSDEGSKMGTLFVLTDGTTTSITDMGTEIDAPAIDFAATIVSTNVQITGTALTGAPTTEFIITMRHVQ